jgi:hypothetical protein
MSFISDILDPKYVGKSLLKIYEGVKSPNHSILTDYWTFFSVNDLKKEKDFNKMINIGSKYQGMGWYISIAYIPETDNFCFRIDGGSNDYDRLDNYNFYKSDKYNPVKFIRFDTLPDEKKNITSNILTVDKLRDFKSGNIQYTYDDLDKLGFFNNIKMIKDWKN